MNSNNSMKNIIYLSVFIVAVVVFFTSLSSLFNMDSTSPFTTSESINFTVEQDGTYYFMKDDYHEDDVYTGTQETAFTEIHMNSDIIWVTIQNVDTEEYYHIDVINPNTSITINGYDVIGSVDLEAGSYQVSTVIITGTYIDSNFMFTKTGMVGDILTLLASFFGGIIAIVLFFVQRGNERRRRRRKSEEELWHYDEPSSVDIFDVDDAFDNYNKNKKR